MDGVGVLILIEISEFIVAKGPKSMIFTDKIIIAYIPIFRIVISSHYAII